MFDIVDHGDNGPEGTPSKRVLLKVQSSVYPTGNILIYDEFRAVVVQFYGDVHHHAVKLMIKQFPDLKVRGTKIYVMGTVYPELQTLDLDETPLIKDLWPDW